VTALDCKIRTQRKIARTTISHALTAIFHLRRGVAAGAAERRLLRLELFSAEKRILGL
jgi:hypothetical protein